MSPTRYMAVAYADEIPVPACIETFAFKNGGSGTTLLLTDLEVYMGYTDNTNLGAVFLENYIAGTRQLVLQADSIYLTADVDTWCEFELDTPFTFYPEHHMLLEFCFTDGSTGMHNFIWTTETSRSVISYSVEASQGNPAFNMIHLLLTGSELSMSQETFGRVKIILGQ